MLLKNPMIKCPACKIATCTLFFEADDPKTKKGYQFFKCKNCKLVQINPHPESSDFERIYKLKNIHKNFTKNNFLAKVFFKFPMSNNLFNLYLKMVKKSRSKLVYNYKDGGRLLDVGFGDGKMLEAFSGSNWQLYGTEVNEFLAKKAQKNLKKTTLIISRLEEAGLPKNYFDTITFWHVLEHINNPEVVLRETQKLLKPNGIVIMEIPSGSSLFLNIFKKNWQQLIVPEHLYFYTEKSLKKLLKVANLKIVDIEYSGIFSFSGPSSLANLLRSKGLNNELISVISIFSYPIFIATNLLSGKYKENMQIIASIR